MKHFHFSMNITQINKNGYYSDEKYYEAIKKIYKNPFDSERKKWATKENHVLSPGFHGTKEVPAAFCDKGIDRYIKEEGLIPEENSKEEILEQLGGLTKVQLELIGRDYGVELDRRKTKAKLVGEITELLNG